MAKETLLETTYSPTALKVDREAGVIKDVKILGRASKNGREYSDKALREAASMYEGMGVNLDHPDRKNPNAERSVLDTFGELRGVATKADGNFGDLHFIKSHPAAAQVCESAERFPLRLGLSHNADGLTSRKNGKVIVESIECVRSVDLVQKPATNQGLFESENPTMKKTVKQILEAVYGKKLTGSKLLEMDGAMAPEVEVAADADGDGQIDAAFKAMVNSVLDDDKLDIPGKLAKIKQILTAQETLLGLKDGPPPESETAAESAKPVASTDPNVKALMETVRELTRERDHAKAETACRALLESVDREATDIRVRSLMALPESDRKTLAESWPKRAQPSNGRPATSPPARLLESEGVTAYPANHDGFLSAIR